MKEEMPMRCCASESKKSRGFPRTTTSGTWRAGGSIGAIIEYEFSTWEKRRGIVEDRHRSSESSFLLEGGHETERVPMRLLCIRHKRRLLGVFFLLFL